MLFLTAALFGIGAFLFALRGIGDPRNMYPGRVLPFGVVYLIAGLTAASLVTWRGRWRSGAQCGGADTEADNVYSLVQQSTGKEHMPYPSLAGCAALPC